MTRKHYRKIAAAIAEAEITQEARETIAADLAAVCASENKAFDLDRFMAASGASGSYVFRDMAHTEVVRVPDGLPA
jgi:hypothetical protein